MIAIILINFGGPRSREEVRPFLEEIFRDVLPKPLKFTAPILARLREPVAQRMYASIGGASPVVGWTRWQAAELKSKIKNQKSKFNTYIGMKYGKPSVKDAIEEARNDGAEKIILLPLFPYQSKYTSISGVATFRLRQLAQTKVCYSINKQWHTHPLYIRAMVDIIKSALAKWRDTPPPNINLLFSIHAIPLSWVKAGSPYLKQVHESVAEIMKCFVGCNYYIAFQSAYGPIRWTGPSVKETLNLIFKNTNHESRTTNHVLIIPLGFACENIETLYEIDQVYIPYAEQALQLQNIARTPTLNDHPQFIDLTAELVFNALLK